VDRGRVVHDDRHEVAHEPKPAEDDRDPRELVPASRDVRICCTATQPATTAATSETTSMPRTRKLAGYESTAAATARIARRFVPDALPSLGRGNAPRGAGPTPGTNGTGASGSAA
jgi:hypothetical protein